MDLKEIISRGESETLEFKESPGEHKEIIETITAFSNTEGGKIIIGVSKSGKLLGVEVGKDTIEHLTNKIAQNTDPRIHSRITVEKINSKSVIIIEAKESSDHLVLAFGRPFKRVGKSTVKMSKDGYERLILEKHKEKLYFDSQICKGAKLKDINKERLLWFIKEARVHRGLDVEDMLPTEEILERLKLLKERKLTNAAILLFGKNPQKFFLQTVIKAIRFKGTDVTEDMIDFKTMEGDILIQLKRAEDFIFEHIPKQAWIEEGKLQRQEKWLYPPKAIREALANALAHRDYETTSSVQVRIFDDRLEIWNPGCLPPGLTVEKLKTKHDSIPRNPLIARAFFWVKYVEEVGTGTNKMIRWCKEWELPEPEFEDTGTSFVVTIRKSRLTEEYLISLELNERQRKAIEYLIQHKYITNREYREINGIGKVVSAKELNIMVKKDILRRIGKGRTLRYELND
ncbi:helix-turn-helix domain-containing protein [Thermodesulfovibrionales bacterium]|nr:helix-turn-helix domain-containing protein [Thermodesulfovibrionales bacterium]